MTNERLYRDRLSYRFFASLKGDKDFLPIPHFRRVLRIDLALSYFPVFDVSVRSSLKRI